jgi:hypothetical protein
MAEEEWMTIEETARHLQLGKPTADRRARASLTTRPLIPGDGEVGTRRHSGATIMRHVNGPSPASSICVLALLALGTLCLPASVHAQGCSTPQGCATLMLNGMAGSLGKDIEGQAWGWVMGGSQATGTGPIVNELGTIEDTLNTISNQLTAISNELEQLNCGIDTQFVSTYAGGIQSYFQLYQVWVQNMRFGAPPPKVSDVSEWAHCAIGLTGGQSCNIAGGVSVMTMLNQLANAASATGGSNGSIAACIKASSTAAPASTLDDRPWYAQNVEPITGWYLGINAQALAVLIEAWHFEAWEEAGSPQTNSPDEIVATICGSIKTDGCVSPISYYENVFLPNLKAQMRAGGAPYSTDQYLLTVGQPLLLSRSIEAYQQAADPNNAAGCASAPGSLTSAAPCGATVGYYNDAFPSVAFGPYGYGSKDSSGNSYGSWVSSAAGAFQALTTNGGFNTYPFSNVTASRFLCTLSASNGDTTKCLQANGGAGLQVGSKIVQFSDLETSSIWVQDAIGNPLIRFLDGGLRNSTYTAPVMNNVYNENLKNYGEGCQVGGNTGLLINYRPDGTGDSSDTPYYEFSICYRPGAYYKQDYIVKPHFDPRNPVRQYRWPALDWTALTCSDGSKAAQALNPAGMPTLCGADFDAWFANIAPNGPNTSSLMTSADATLDSGAPDSNYGKELSLSLGSFPPLHDSHKWVVVGFAENALQEALAAGEVAGVFLALRPQPTLPRDDSAPRGIAKKADNWPRIEAHSLSGGFVEGNGSLSGSLSPGSGATWLCAEEAIPGDGNKQCVQEWPRPLPALLDRKTASTTQQPWSNESALIWDVTQHVKTGTNRWMIKLDEGTPFSSGGSELLLYSREAAEQLGAPNLAPHLLIVYKDSTKTGKGLN